MKVPDLLHSHRGQNIKVNYSETPAQSSRLILVTCDTHKIKKNAQKEFLNVMCAKKKEREEFFPYNKRESQHN